MSLLTYEAGICKMKARISRTGAGDVAQVVESLLTKYKALSTIPTKKKKKLQNCPQSYLFKLSFKKQRAGRAQWLTPIVLATREYGEDCGSRSAQANCETSS
jgi:hypothetical protein